MGDQVQKQLNSLWEARVKSLGFDLLNHSVTFELEFNNMGLNSSHLLRFSGVSAFCFVNNDGQERLYLPPAEPDDYVELTSVYYDDAGVGEFRLTPTADWEGHKFNSRPNFTLEIWSSWMLVEASHVTIDTITLEVGYPANSK
jgi:hypothetical protein